MLNINANKVEKANKSAQISILLLLALVIVFGLLNTYKFLKKEPTLTPQQAELKSLKMVVQKNPDSIHSRLLLGYSYQKLNDYSNSQKQYYEVLKLDDKNVTALYNIGLTFQQQRNFNKSENYYKKTIEVKPNHILGLVGLGEVYLETGEYDEAIKVLETALTFEKQLVNPRLLLAKALEKKGEKVKAISEYKTVLKYIPNDRTAIQALDRLRQEGDS